MKTATKFQPQFEKSSTKTTAEIKAACQKIQSVEQPAYDIRSNGDHIWVEVDDQRKQYWSPMLHLRLVNADNETRIKGEFAENPILWIVFTALKVSSVGIFILSGIVAWLKFNLGYNFNAQLFVMFAMVSVWFAMHLAAERYRRKGAKQIEQLHDFVNCIAA